LKVFAENPDAFIAEISSKSRADATALTNASADVANLIKTLKSVRGATVETSAQVFFFLNLVHTLLSHLNPCIF